MESSALEERHSRSKKNLGRCTVRQIPCIDSTRETCWDMTSHTQDTVASQSYSQSLALVFGHHHSTCHESRNVASPRRPAILGTEILQEAKPAHAIEQRRRLLATTLYPSRTKTQCPFPKLSNRGSLVCYLLFLLEEIFFKSIKRLADDQQFRSRV
jgi:hypothetical protein